MTERLEVEMQAIRLPSRPESIALARVFAAENLQRLGAGDDVIEEARLLVSELATNVIMHARTPMEVRVGRLVDGTFRVAIVDHAPERSIRKGPRPTAVGGRGVLLVDAIADDWGVDQTHDRKAVWFRLSS